MARGFARGPRKLDSIRRTAATLLVVGIAVLLPGTGCSQTWVAGWGDLAFDTRNNDQAVVQLGAGYTHTVVRRADGSIVAWGNNQNGQCNVPPRPPCK